MTITTAPAIVGATLPRIRGALCEKVLRKSPELFNQSLATVLAETLQNARRAGATRVDIEIIGKPGNATLILRDDGCGIADFAKLVTFGASSWDEVTDVTENAAGMGVFSLASRGVTIRSRGRRVTLTREVFCGEAEAIVLPDVGALVGAELMFPAREADVERLVELAVRFYPVPVTLNGKPARQTGFLAGAVYTVEWQGLRLGVFRNDLPPELFAPGDWPWPRSTNNLYLNFHGHVVAAKGRVHLHEIKGPDWFVAVDVLNAPDLRLVLPARNEPIENDFFRALRARAERAIYECIAGQPAHTLAFTHFQRARELGIALPPAEITLAIWSGCSEELRHQGAVCRSS